MNLTSQAHQTTSTTSFKNEPFYLQETNGFNAWNKNLKFICGHQGVVAACIFSNQTPTLPPIDVMHSLNDPKVNILTNKPFNDGRYHYERTPEEDELTSEAMEQYQKDLDRISKQKDKREECVNKYVVEDNTVLKYVWDTISPAIRALIQSNTLYAAWTQLPIKSYDKTSKLLLILQNTFVKGNAAYTVAEISKFMGMTQSPGEKMHEYTQRVLDASEHIFPLIESIDHPGYFKLDRLLSMVTINGLDKTNTNTVRTLHDFLVRSDNNASAMDQPLQLIEVLNQSVHSDTLTAPSSEQSGAFATITAPSNPRHKNKNNQKPGEPGYGARDLSRPHDHCTFCLATKKLYFYHKTARCYSAKEAAKTFANATTISAPLTGPSAADTAAFIAQAPYHGYYVPSPDDP